MPSGPEQLVVRQHERYLCRVAGKARVAEEMGERVVLASSAGDGAGGVQMTVVDCSRGGLGLETSVFFPRGCRLKLTVEGLLVEGPDHGMRPGELAVRVQRATMTDRKPTYYLGLSFVGEGDLHVSLIAKMLELAKAASTNGAATSGGPQKGAA